MTAVHIINRGDIVGNKPAKPRRQHRLSLAAEIKQARKAGAYVTGATVELDKVTLTFGEPVKSSGGELEDWMAKHAN